MSLAVRFHGMNVCILISRYIVLFAASGLPLMRSLLKVGGMISGFVAAYNSGVG